MTDILVRAIPAADAALIAANAERKGISQVEYLRQVIHDGLRRDRIPLRELAGSCTGMFPDDMWAFLDRLDAEWDE